MPTHDEDLQFLREFAALSPAQRARFLDAMHKMVNDLRAGQPFRSSLRVKRVQKAPGVYEMTWSGDGRATFEIGQEVLAGETHVIWRRIGGHDILNNP
jgi:hypothetical protein